MKKNRNDLAWGLSGVIMLAVIFGVGRALDWGDGSSRVVAELDPSAGDSMEAQIEEPLLLQPVQKVGKRTVVAKVQATAELSEPLSSGTIRVLITDEAGVPVNAASVELYKAERVRNVSEERSSSTPGVRPDHRKQTDEFGAALFEAVADDDWRVWAGSREYYYHSSSEFSLGVGNESEEVQLELEAYPANRFVKGVVLDPEGELVNRARVELSWEADGRQRSAYAFSREEGGGFSFRTQDVVRSGTLVASDPSGKWREVLLTDVNGGSSDTVLQLQSSRVIEFEIFGAGRDLTESVKIETKVKRGGRWAKKRNTTVPNDNWTSSLFLLMLPDEPFLLSLSHRGFESKDFGPFDPEAVAEREELELVAYPRVIGRVLVSGEPTGGMRVSMPGAFAMKRPDATGVFDLACTKTGLSKITATHPLYGSATSREFEIPLSGEIFVEVNFDEFGFLAGQVLAPSPWPGESERLLFLYHNETGTLCKANIAQDGSFVVPKLQPGTWSLSITYPLVSAFGRWVRDPLTGGIRRAEPYLKSYGVYLADVVVGERTKVSLDFRTEASTFLTGSFGFVYRKEWGTPVGFCGTGIPQSNIQLRTPGELQLMAMAIYDNSTFSLHVREAGAYRIRASALVLRDSLFVFWKDIELKPGSNEWEFRNVAARIQLDLSARQGEPHGTVLFKWSDGEGTTCSGTLGRNWPVNKANRRGVVPSGRVELYLKGVDGFEELLTVVTVAPDEDLVVEL